MKINSENISKVYNLLADEESRAIFWDRFKYSITYDRRYLMDAVVDSYLNNNTFANPSNKELVELAKKIATSNEECEIAIFGASDNSMTIVELLYEYGIIGGNAHCECYYVDNDSSKWGNTFGWHNPQMHMMVYNPERLKNNNKKTYVILAVGTYTNDTRITKQLIDLGIEESHIFHRLVSHEYFLGSMYLAEDIMVPVAGDVICDIGAFDMENSQKYLKWNPSLKHIYAFEADPVSFNVCKTKNLGDKVDIYNLGVWSCKSQLAFESAPNGELGGSRINENGQQLVDVVALDEFLGKQKVDIIKMDIEGAELEALKGAQELIKTNKPCLTISIYHKPEDIIELPLYVCSLNPDYKIYLRHHTYGIFDTVMYAIDKNRGKRENI